MTVFGVLGFTTPWLLAALAALPILWLLLRAVPPAPIRRMFPGVILLLGLKDDDQVTDRTPWWLLLLRMLSVAAIIIGLAGPVLNPQDRQAGNGPMLILLDGSWASARNWTATTESLQARLKQATLDGRPVAMVRLTTPEVPVFQPADTWISRLPGFAPQPWAPDGDDLAEFAEDLDGDFDTLWVSDGLHRDSTAGLLAALQRRGNVSVIEGGRQLVALAPVTFQDGVVNITARRPAALGSREISVAAHGLDPSGTPRILARLPLVFADTETEVMGGLSLPAELRARVTRFAVENQTSAAAVTLTDDSLRRREVALIAGRDDREGLELLSPLHYLNRALEPNADLLDGTLITILPANPDVIVLADVATLSAGETADLLDWIDKGGLLLRFAGPRMAASDISRAEEDPLMPVRLRAGGRTVGGAMSWGEPKALAPFHADSPFFGLPIPDDVRVKAQVMAQPDPTLADRVIAQLSDGTPLVTRKRIGLGQVVLVHVTANAEWSTLPLSGLFVQMLERLAVSTTTTAPNSEEMAGTIWQPELVMDAFGVVQEAKNLPGVAGDTLVDGALNAELRPGIYAGQERRIARNVIGADTELGPVVWPGNVPVEGLTTSPERALGGMLLAGAIVLLLMDVIATLALSGRLRMATAALVLVAALPVTEAQAQTEQRATVDAIDATAQLHLGHVITGDKALDDMAAAGLRGLSDTLFFRTSVEPANPIAVNLETDELAFFPLLYWPISPDQPIPSDEAYVRINTYLRSGGMILFDTRDANIAGFGAASPNGRKLQQIARALDIPPLEPIPQDHVLTRAFYLLQDFPGRHVGRQVWVEAAPPDAQQAEGMPFRNLNDGVSPVVIGGNDWAAAWATDTRGNLMFPVGRGFSGERQRELAYRFGVNLVMHVLTGNYKSDQVHVPALLDRLGQ